ncbi:hypothetical protein Bca101_083276 [Brassica carinata]
MTANALTADAGLIITSIGCFSGESWKVLSPGPLSLCSIKFGFTSISIYSHLCFEDLFQRLHTFQPQDHLTASASIDKAFFVRGIPPSTCRPDPGFRSLCHVCRNIYPDKSYFAIIVHVFPPLGLAGRPAYSGEGSFSLTSVSYPSTGSLSSISDHHLCVTSRFTWSDVVQQSSSNNWLRPNKMLILVNPLSSFSKPSTASTLPPFPLPMERDDSSALLRRLFRLLIGLLSCGAVSTGPEDAIENTSVFLVDEVWISTSYYVTILQLTDFVVKAPPTHSSIVSNSLSSSNEDLSRLAYLYVAFYTYEQRGWIIPSFYCMEED